MPRALILDDSELIRKTYYFALRGEHRCDLSGDGTKGLALFRQALDAGDPYRFVLTDLTMPLGGARVVQAMRLMEQAQPDLAPARILVISSRADDPSLEPELRGCGVDALLLKPVMPSTLRAILVRLD
jgi:two-component system, chemotaxis family, chemotaxis protein CheY